ncbi:NYN domain-containing protein [Cupriavidus sp. UYPR2.512]|uniref:NYN domain-containing protein n=1 Tax=Cupriavidus sp. UYPR2.512 TaxID=1080187 RepID=UPI000377DA97|nr:NYN domain-containing protein [Cupriavidus sp. UYPR2.512]UIF88112.1 NYN domain-containing protein [Cupriavidus necator]
MPTAILIDGAYFIKRFRALDPEHAYDPERAAECAHAWACAHLVPPRRNGAPAGRTRELYRIFFYDCPPLDKKMHHPITGRAIDFSKSEEAIFRTALHTRLRAKRKLALRLGHLSTHTSWTIRPDKITELLKRKISIDDLKPEDVRVDTKQKGVDMRIGIDVASLAFKKQVDQIVLIAGDADFVPAAKQARRERIDFILDPMWQAIPEGLQEHIDGLRSTCPRPRRGRLATQPSEAIPPGDPLPPEAGAV